MEYIHHYDSPLGGITMAGDGVSLTGLWFDGQKHFPDSLGACREEELPVFGQVSQWLDIYFSGSAPGFTPPLSLKSTAFRQAVWNILLSIPYGRTMTYGEIADRIAGQRGGGRMYARAVGQAVSLNPVSLIVPCHRVVGAGGNLTGYAGGIEKKARLLELEGMDMTVFNVPPALHKAEPDSHNNAFTDRNSFRPVQMQAADRTTIS